MNTPSPYNANPELSAMKEDVASRSLNLSIKSGLITVATVAVGAAGAALLFPLAGPGVAFSAFVGGAAGLLASGPIIEMATLKERTKLQIDEEMVQSYMAGKNYWGEGFREEVAEHGYAGPQATPHVGGPNPQRPRGGGTGIS